LVIDIINKGSPIDIYKNENCRAPKIAKINITKKNNKKIIDKSDSCFLIIPENILI
jgi:hypothetical protein